MPLTIDVYMSEFCASQHSMSANIDRALAELGVRADVAYHTIYYDDAVAMNIQGSPSIWINGRDAFEGGNSPGIT